MKMQHVPILRAPTLVPAKTATQEMEQIVKVINSFSLDHPLGVGPVSMTSQIGAANIPLILICSSDYGLYCDSINSIAPPIA